MEPVTLLRCSRCSLMWAQEEDTVTCPRCRVHHRFTRGHIEVAGLNVPVGAVVLFAYKGELESMRVRHPDDRRDKWAERCVHGLISWRLCGECSAN